jgi:hypothetical protein
MFKPDAQMLAVFEEFNIWADALPPLAVEKES